HIESNEILKILLPLLPGHLLQRIQGLPSGCIHFLNMFETCLPLFGQSSILGLLGTFTCSTAAILCLPLLLSSISLSLMLSVLYYLSPLTLSYLPPSALPECLLLPPPP